MTPFRTDTLHHKAINTKTDPSMTIQLAEHYGLCFGVRDAIAGAQQLAATFHLDF